MVESPAVSQQKGISVEKQVMPSKTMHVAFIYTPSLDSETIEAFFVAMHSKGAMISHLGKSEPPKKWTLSLRDAVTGVANGSNLTNTTFVRSIEKSIGITIDQHRDERWTHDTIAIDGPDEFELRDLACTIGTSTDAYLVMIGTAGGGKNQDWEIISRRTDCPPDLLIATK